MTTVTSVLPTTQKTRRLVGLDGLRGLLSLCVVVVHVTGFLSPLVLERVRLDLLGQAIVVFFAMSGFLIFQPFLSRILQGKPGPALGEYARLRVFRIFPAYVVIFLVANFALHAVFLRNAVIASTPRTTRGTGVITNPLELLVQLTAQQNYSPNLLQTGINSSWTLTVEIAFYALLPFLSLFAARVRARHPGHRYLAALLPAGILLVVGVGFRITAAVIAAANPELSVNESEWGPTTLAVLSRSILVWSDTFAFGMIAAVVVAAVRAGDLDRFGRISVRAMALVVFVAGLVGSAISLVTVSRMIGTFIGLASLGLIVLIVLPTARGGVWRVSVVLDWLPFRYLGMVSLSIYLWHYPVLIVFTRMHLYGPDTIAGAAWNFLVVTVVSVALASVTYWLIERPALRWRPRAVAARNGAGVTP